MATGLKFQRSLDIHVDQQDRPPDLFGQPTMPNILLAGTQLLAVEFLERCLRDMEPLAALTGGAGTGKTLGLNTALTRRESAGDRVIRVNNFVAGPLSLHRVLAASLGVADAGELSAEELEPVLRKALAEIGQAEPPVLAVDDAQSLLPETLRYLCLLAGLREAGRPLFRILLVGRPGFTARQPMPLHFNLEPMQPNATREIVQHGLAAAGVMATEEKIQDIVQAAQGNLRTLVSLLQASVEEARTRGRGRMTATGPQVKGTMRRKSRPERRRSFGAWLVVPALLVVGAAGAAIVFHDGTPDRHDDKPIQASPIPPPAAPPVTKSTDMPAGRADQPVASVPPPPSSISPPTPLPAPPQSRAASGDADHGVGQGVAAPASTEPPAPVPAPPHPATPPAPAAAPAPVAAMPVPPSATIVPAPQPQPQPQASAVPQPQAVDRTPAPPVAPTQQAARFRVYNIGACHRGVCPRWSVTNLDQRSRFVAAFDLSALHLDRETMRRVREGTLDLIVSGSVRGGPDGRILVADTLQTVIPHHGLLRPSSSEPADLAAPPQTQSPPPGFLALPVGSDSAEPAPLAPQQ